MSLKVLSLLCRLDFVSQIGGMMGLFIGFSICSLVEIVYWFTYRLGANARKVL